MDMETPTAAVHAGSLARTYEYRTPGVQTAPHIRWSFALKPGARITCPILVSQDRVYVGDSAGYFSALDARSGDLVWSFPTDWVENPQKSYFWDLEGVVACCLDGALGYVASALGTLSELDLRTGQVRRSWSNNEDDFDEEDEDARLFDPVTITDLFLHQGLLFLAGGTEWGGEGGGPGIYPFNPLTSELFGPVLEWCARDYDFLPGMYQPSNGEPAIFFHLEHYPHTGESYFIATELPGATAKGRLLWSTSDHSYGPYHSSHPNDPLTTDKRRGTIVGHNTAMMDGVLYAFGSFFEWHKVGNDEDDREFTALLAFDPKLGAVQWRVEFPVERPEDAGFLEEFSPLQLVATANQVFLVTEDRVESVDLKTHQGSWTWEADFQVGHALVADGLLYVLDTQGEIIALDVSTGDRRWNWQVEGEILKDWSTIDKGTLYIATTDTLYALCS